MSSTAPLAPLAASPISAPPSTAKIAAPPAASLPTASLPTASLKSAPLAVNTPTSFSAKPAVVAAPFRAAAATVKQTAAPALTTAPALTAAPTLTAKPKLSTAPKLSAAPIVSSDKPAPVVSLTPSIRKQPTTGHESLTRETYTASNEELPDGELGTLKRSEGQPKIGDAPIDDAHDNAGIVHDFFKTVLKRNSVDNKGMALQSISHYGKDFNNAYWDGSRMTYGDGDGTTFKPFPGALDVVAHEITHGITERTAGLNYEKQPGALNESWSDVFGEFVEQWHNDKESFKTPEGAKKADWQIGEDVFTPGKEGDALRSMKSPGTGYEGDPQPAHMKDYKEMDDDNGGVHVNSGIPNKAAFEVASRLGGEKTAQIWYKALTDYMKPNSRFQDAANYTVSAAKDLFNTGPEVQAVRDAWKAVGLNPRTVRPSAHRELRPVSVTAAKNPGVVPPWFQKGAHGAPEPHPHLR